MQSYMFVFGQTFASFKDSQFIWRRTADAHIIRGTKDGEHLGEVNLQGLGWHKMVFALITSINSSVVGCLAQRQHAAQSRTGPLWLYWQLSWTIWTKKNLEEVTSSSTLRNRKWGSIMVQLCCLWTCGGNRVIYVIMAAYSWSSDEIVSIQQDNDPDERHQFCKSSELLSDVCILLLPKEFQPLWWDTALHYCTTEAAPWENTEQMFV